MNRALQRDLRPLVPVFVVVLLVAFTLGYWTGGGRGAVTATGAMVLGMLVLSGLRLGFTHILDGSGVTWWSVITGAMLLFGVFVISQYGLLHRYSDAAVLLVLGGCSVGIGGGVGYLGGRDLRTGLAHGVLTGGVAGLLLVLIATHQSFSMRPALNVIILLSGVVAPLSFGMLCGLGGSIRDDSCLRVYASIQKLGSIWPSQTPG